MHCHALGTLEQVRLRPAGTVPVQGREIITFHLIITFQASRDDHMLLKPGQQSTYLYKVCSLQLVLNEINYEKS